jgi:FkbM family methyltransferase
MPIKPTIKRVLQHFGYSVQRAQRSQGKDAGYVRGRDPFEDIGRLTSSDRPVVLDVGANTGQSVKNFRNCLKNPEIHSFEPGEDAFRALTENTRGLTDVHIVNSGMGARREIKTFVENQFSVMSSFLEPGEDAWGSITRRCPVQLDTIDDYCNRGGIGHIDILKSDTQGYDLEVFRGADRMLREKKIDLIYLELIFSKMYLGTPRFDEVYAFLVDHGMSLVSFYQMHYQHNLLSWTDALFANVQNLPRLREMAGSTEIIAGHA